MLAHVPSFWRNPRGSPDFLAYPVPKACMHVLGTRVPRRLGVARSASSPKAAQALGCSLTPGLRISFGRVTCMARAASVPGLWALGFLLLCGVCVWVRFAVGCGFCEPRQSWLGSWVGLFGHGLWCCPSSVGCLWCSRLEFGFGLLMGRVWFRARPACPPLFPVLACGVGVRAGSGSWLCPAFRGWVVGVCFLRLFFFFFCRVSLSRALWSLSPHPLPFGLGCWPLFFSSCVSACFGVPFPGGPLFLAWCCRFWLGGPPVPLRGSSLRCLREGGFVRLWWCWRAVWWLWAVFAPPPLPPLFFFGGGAACSSLSLPWLAHALARIQCCLPGCCLQLRSVWPRSGPMGWEGYVHGGLGAPSCRVGSWFCRPGGCARRLLVALG